MSPSYYHTPPPAAGKVRIDGNHSQIDTSAAETLELREGDQVQLYAEEDCIYIAPLLPGRTLYPSCNKLNYRFTAPPWLKEGIYILPESAQPDHRGRYRLIPLARGARETVCT